jgi:hypothetical protein
LLYKGRLQPQYDLNKHSAHILKLNAMKPKKCITNFSGLRQSDLETTAQAVVRAMTGNVHFPDLGSEIAAGDTALSDYSASLANAKTGGAEAKSIKNKKKDNLLRALHVIAVRVNLAADGDKEMLDSSAIPLQKDRPSAHRKDAGSKDGTRPS